MTTNEIIDPKGQNDFSTDRRIPLARLFANGGWLRRELGRSGLGPLLHESRSGHALSCAVPDDALVDGAAGTGLERAFQCPDLAS